MKYLLVGMLCSVMFFCSCIGYQLNKKYATDTVQVFTKGKCVHIYKIKKYLFREKVLQQFFKIYSAERKGRIKIVESKIERDVYHIVWYDVNGKVLKKMIIKLKCGVVI